MRLYNSLTQAMEPVEPLQPGRLGMYVCGVTVYDDPHIGHLRAAYLFELFRRLFQALGWQVRYVRNVTDLDDKIIDKARVEMAGRAALGASVQDTLSRVCRQIASRYTQGYHQELKRFGLPDPDVEPRATDHIPQMIQLIERLVAKGQAYAQGGDVYFRVRKWPAYGRLSHQSVEALRAGARVEPGDQKEDPLDFALWKASKPDEPAWESPWGPGRPGWHIECSAMSMAYLGESFDLHGGGRDLIFPHHENEIAQSEAATGQPFVRQWIHSGLVSVRGQKMAKSLGNIVRLHEVLMRHPNPDVLKLLFLMTHYASPLDFAWEKLDETATAYQRFTTLFETVERLVSLRERTQGRLARQIAPVFQSSVATVLTRFDAALAQDLNTPEAVAALFELVRMAHEALGDGHLETAAALVTEITQRGMRLCLFELARSRRMAVDEQRILALITKRDAARQAKDFAGADGIRQELQQMGVILEDTKEGTIWRLG